MIRIPRKQRTEITFHDYDILLSVYAYRNKLKNGECANSITLNASIAFWLGVFSLFCLLLLYFTADAPIRGRDAAVDCFIGVAGTLCVICGAVITTRMKRQFSRVMKITVRGDIVFDATGVHVWENPEKGFDKTWEQFSDCFISSEYIFIFFRTTDYTIALINQNNYEEQVLEALSLGNRTDIVTRFEAEGRQLKGLINPFEKKKP